MAGHFRRRPMGQRPLYRPVQRDPNVGADARPIPRLRGGKAPDPHTSNVGPLFALSDNRQNRQIYTAVFLELSEIAYRTPLHFD